MKCKKNNNKKTKNKTKKQTKKQKQQQQQQQTNNHLCPSSYSLKTYIVHVIADTTENW